MHNTRALLAGVGEQNKPGPVHCYKFPPEVEGEHIETQAHAGPIERMRITLDDMWLFTAGSDGCLIIWEIKDKEARLARGKDIGLPFSEELLLTRQDEEEKQAELDSAKARIADLQQNTNMK